MAIALSSSSIDRSYETVNSNYSILSFNPQHVRINENRRRKMSENKCVIVLNENLPLGQLVNSAAVLMMSIGKLHPDLVGRNLEDGSGHMHQGITTVPLPILKGAGKLKEIREGLKLHEGELTVVDLIDATSTTASYE